MNGPPPWWLTGGLLVVAVALCIAAVTVWMMFGRWFPLVPSALALVIAWSNHEFCNWLRENR